MLEIFDKREIEWNPPSVSCEKKIEIYQLCVKQKRDNLDYMAIIQVEPYIDAILYCAEVDVDGEVQIKDYRFIFRENYIWNYEHESLFVEKCLRNGRIYCDGGMLDEVFDYYSKRFPEWKLQRYYTKPMRLLDHIYHCMQKGTAKEMLYKASLDELAENVDLMDEINLLSNKPSDIYEGLSMRTLRALNCKEGGVLLSKASNRAFVKDLQRTFPEMFKDRLNDSHCKYLQFLIDGELTMGEAGRLFLARKTRFLGMWLPTQYDMFIWDEETKKEELAIAKEIADIDPIYKKYVERLKNSEEENVHSKITPLKTYLLCHRKEYDILMRRSNRKRRASWQERDNGYVVRYPQTINDFCREAIYMSNCLITYVDAYVNNDTTILFMRKIDDINMPFITIEIFNDRLMQAYHRFNHDCTKEEAEWILEYCARHNIDPGDFKFNADEDLLF